jgi:hypothetical protein
MYNSARPQKVEGRGQDVAKRQLETPFDDHEHRADPAAPSTSAVDLRRLGRPPLRRFTPWLLAAVVVAMPTLMVRAQDDEIDFMPGHLSRAHEGLEDPDSCDNCHDDDLNVDGERCLVCHDQIAERIAAQKGVHREVTPADCAICHVEHQGRDADLRPLDTAGFDHAG